jgi:hypothetical protein
MVRGTRNHENQIGILHFVISCFRAAAVTSVLWSRVGVMLG